jgi:hypothetical protein
MRAICSVLGVAASAAILLGGFAATAHAGNWDDCGKPPPAWYTAPRFSHTYSNEYGRGYGRATHEYSAQRHSGVRYTSSRRFGSHDAFGRW